MVHTEGHLFRRSTEEVKVMGRKLVSQMTPEELEKVRAKKREEYAKYREKNKEKVLEDSR